MTTTRDSKRIGIREINSLASTYGPENIFWGENGSWVILDKNHKKILKQGRAWAKSIKEFLSTDKTKNTSRQMTLPH